MTARPSWGDAVAAVVRHEITGRWLHEDPAEICRIRGGSLVGHPSEAAAIGCEHNSQLIDWKRRRG